MKVYLAMLDEIEYLNEENEYIDTKVLKGFKNIEDAIKHIDDFVNHEMLLSELDEESFCDDVDPQIITDEDTQEYIEYRYGRDPYVRIITFDSGYMRRVPLLVTDFYYVKEIEVC